MTTWIPISFQQLRPLPILQQVIAHHKPLCIWNGFNNGIKHGHSYVITCYVTSMLLFHVVQPSSPPMHFSIPCLSPCCPSAPVYPPSLDNACLALLLSWIDYPASCLFDALGYGYVPKLGNVWEILPLLWAFWAWCNSWFFVHPMLMNFFLLNSEDVELQCSGC